MPTIKTDDIDYREDLYPRSGLNLSAIKRYRNAIDNLPPIEVNQDNILIDGLHRLRAHEREDYEEIDVTITEATEEEVYRIAVERNAQHGLQLSAKEKKRYAISFIAQYDADKLSEILSVTPQTIRSWTKSKRQSLKEKRDEQIKSLYLRAWNTQQDIADDVGCGQATVNRIIQNEQIFVLDKPDDFEPKIYKVWNYSSCNNAVKWTGNIPQDIAEQLLYYYTEPMDIVFDPFAGGGITIDACQKWNRRYWTSDIDPAPERGDDMLKHDISEGMPKGLGSHQLTFLDPPYWKMKRGKYTEEETDLSNMDLDEFLDTIEMIAKEAKSEVLAIIISPIQKDWGMTDLTMLCYDRIRKHRELIDRLSVPYTTQIHGGAFVDLAKEKKKTLYLVRDILIFGGNNG